MSGTRERDFLSRWSRLKRAGGDTAGSADQPAPQPPDAAAPAGAEGEQSDSEILAEHGLPDPDGLGPDDDVSGFMARTVPDRLRNRALRRLWLRNPVLANLDELVDYGEDYTDAATVVETLASAWQAGRGYLTAEPAEAGEAADRPAPPEGGARGGDAAPDAGSDRATEDPETAPPLPAGEGAPAPAHGLGNAPPAPEAETAAPRPGAPTVAPAPAAARRRMRFRV